MRKVPAWTRAGLNEVRSIPAMASDTLGLLVDHLRHQCYVASLDIRDCFLLWPLHASGRHHLGVRPPRTGRLEVYLFLPPGLGPASAINDRHVGEIVRIAAQPMAMHVVRDVSDLRF